MITYYYKLSSEQFTPSVMRSEVMTMVDVAVGSSAFYMAKTTDRVTNAGDLHALIIYNSK